jgi:hypothetical protein
MVKREWLLLGVIIILGGIIAGCSAPAQAGSQSHVQVVWSENIDTGHPLGYNEFAKIEIPEDGVTCFRTNNANGLAMFCFNEPVKPEISSDSNIICHGEGNNVMCSFKLYDYIPSNYTTIRVVNNVRGM